MRAPYHMTLGWVTPVGSGNLEVDFASISYSRVEGQVALTIPQEQGQDSRSYTMELDLINKSVEDMVDVECSVDMKSNHDYWE